MARRKFFPEREYVHSGQAWLRSFPTISKECRAGPGESVMAEHRATKQKVYTFSGLHFGLSVSRDSNGRTGVGRPGSVGITREFLPIRIGDCRLVMTPQLETNVVHIAIIGGFEA